ncbi:hypothetical protein LZC95_28580 [Pendulispora brunnea]|uniref:Uncharacterized protein n=1 Tax=Pendulispora brunnea TaxID=2905690 RepID=A0ABZ2JVB0_9BACT
MKSYPRIERSMVVPAGLIVLGIMVACGDSGSQKSHEGTLNGLEDSGAGPVVFQPSNLPADICNTATTTDLTVPAGQSVSMNTDQDCDRVIPQGPGLQDICVRIYSTIKIAGTYVANEGSRAGAIVATKSFTLESGGELALTWPGEALGVEPRPGADARGNGTKGSSGATGGGGGGQMTSAGAPGGNSGGAGGPQYGDPTGRQLIGGGYGGAGGPAARPTSPLAIPGAPGAAMQIVACGDLASAGTINATGSDGGHGDYSPEWAGGGAGGGAGGMILIEAAKVTASGGKILARGGNGGPGGPVVWGGSVLLYGGSGGRGGTGASPPTAGENGQTSQPPMPPNQSSGAGGGGGAVGRILINVPQGTSPVLTGVEIDPPAIIGITH